MYTIKFIKYAYLHIISNIYILYRIVCVFIYIYIYIYIYKIYKYILLY